MKPGDKVKFLNDSGGGIIKRILSNNMALVQTKDNFEYPVPFNQLVFIKSNPQTSESTDNKLNENKKKNGH